MSSIAVVTLNFGEPATTELGAVTEFLERIFNINAGLEGAAGDAARARSRQLAQQRAPGLIAEYELIGGSPMNAQSDAHAEALERELAARGRAVPVYSCFQFTEPLPDAIVARAVRDGVRTLVALPVYPLCGPSTTVAAFESLRVAVARAGAGIEVREMSGWHAHPDYIRIRADGIAAAAQATGLAPDDARTALVFSAHGTPLKYLREGSRYDRYVEENCRQVAALAGWSRYVIGWQNHTNRPLEWTQPDIGKVIGEIDADRVIVVPISFVHEQSETLAELDHELRGEAEARGLEFHRVPVPHDDDRLIRLLADLCESFLGADQPHAGSTVHGCDDSVPGARCELRACFCRGREGALCLNGGAL
ncbi:MAG TPA: ferrochelatase [Longimicrobiales bacterium]